MLLDRTLCPCLGTQRNYVVDLLSVRTRGGPFDACAVCGVTGTTRRVVMRSLTLSVTPSMHIGNITPKIGVLPRASDSRTLSSRRRRDVIDSVPVREVKVPSRVTRDILCLTGTDCMANRVITMSNKHDLALTNNDCWRTIGCSAQFTGFCLGGGGGRMSLYICH